MAGFWGAECGNDEKEPAIAQAATLGDVGLHFASLRPVPSTRLARRMNGGITRFDNRLPAPAKFSTPHVLPLYARVPDAIMPDDPRRPPHRQPNDRVITENDLPVNIFQVIDDVSVNGAVLVLRKNRPSIRIVPGAEIDPEQEQILLQEAADTQRNPVIPVWISRGVRG